MGCHHGGFEHLVCKKWRNAMRLYHGSNIDICDINLAMCRPYKDFGRGFYLTDIQQQAEKMEERVSRIYGGVPVQAV